MRRFFQKRSVVRAHLENALKAASPSIRPVAEASVCFGCCHHFVWRAPDREINNVRRYTRVLAHISVCAWWPTLPSLGICWRFLFRRMKKHFKEDVFSAGKLNKLMNEWQRTCPTSVQQARAWPLWLADQWGYTQLRLLFRRCSWDINERTKTLFLADPARIGVEGYKHPQCARLWHSSLHFRYDTCPALKAVSLGRYCTQVAFISTNFPHAGQITDARWII